MLLGFEDLEQALGKNGSWTAYLAGSSNGGMTLALLLGPVLGLLTPRVRRREAESRPAPMP